MNRRFLLKATLLLTATLTVMAGATIAPSLPQMAEAFRDYPRADLLIKLVLTLPALSIAVAGPFVGRWVSRFGRLPVLYAALVLYALAGSTGYWIDSLEGILAGRALLGLAVGMIMTVISTLLGDYFTGQERNQFTGLQSMFMSLGGILFVSLGGWLADINWRFPFVIYLFSLVVLLLAFRFLFEPEKAEKETSGTVVEEGTPPTVYLILGSLFIGMLLFYFIPVQLPFLLKELGVTSASKTGLAIALATLGGAGGSIAYPYLKKRYSYAYLFAFTFALLGTGYLIIGTTVSYNVILLGLLVVGSGTGLMMPNGTLWLLEVTTPAQRSTVMGWMTSAIFLGQFLSPVLVAPVAQWWSLSTLFAAAGGLSVVWASSYLLRGGSSTAVEAV